IPERCEVVEVRNLADAVGYSCSRTASTQCSDCGIELCEPHTENCGSCRSAFCPSCLFFHRAEHPKLVRRPRRKSSKRVAYLDADRRCSLHHGLLCWREHDQGYADDNEGSHT